MDTTIRCTMYAPKWMLLDKAAGFYIFCVNSHVPHLATSSAVTGGVPTNKERMHEVLCRLCHIATRAYIHDT